MKCLIAITIASLALSACGGNEQESYYGSDKAKESQPLAENPPMSADDLDAIVEAEKNKTSTAPAIPATQQGKTNGN